MSRAVSMDGISSDDGSMGDFWSENVAPMLRAGASAAVATGVQTAYADPNVKAAVKEQIDSSLQAQIGKFVTTHWKPLAIGGALGLVAIGYVVFKGRKKTGNPVFDGLIDAADTASHLIGDDS